MSELKQTVNFPGGGDFIVFKGETGRLRATRNRCKHRAGRFKRTDCQVVTCANHGWRLDVETMKYVEPVGKLRQAELEVITLDNDTVQLFELVEQLPWEVDPVSREPLAAGEFTVRFYTHATVEIQCKDATIFTDPWLTGPASTRGWWLTHRPPWDWLQRLSMASAIYISHTHSDHMNLPTLRRLVEMNPDILVFYPGFSDHTGPRLLREVGLRNVTFCDFNRWYPLAEQSRFMLLEDSTGKDDSALLIEYKGHRVLNTVDASVGLNNSILPRPVDLLLTAFAGGAGGHPINWSEMYSEEYIRQRVTQNLRLEAQHTLVVVNQTEPKAFMPFAGYFEVAHPADSEIKWLNLKNSPDEVCRLIQKEYPEIINWIPASGDKFDVGLLKVSSEEALPRLPQAPVYDFKNDLDEIRQSLDFKPLQSVEGVLTYFRWTGYRGNLVLHLIETGENFQDPIREYMLDFTKSDFLISARPNRDHRYLKMRVRADVFRHVLSKGLPWEEISVGFQARFYCEPDVYSYDFWHHLQFKLPEKLPDWE